jgi:hypothetical protein
MISKVFTSSLEMVVSLKLLNTDFNLVVSKKSFRKLKYDFRLDNLNEKGIEFVNTVCE